MKFDPGTLVIHIWGIFDLVVFKVILGSFGGCPKMACNSKMAVRRVKET